MIKGQAEGGRKEGGKEIVYSLLCGWGISVVGSVRGSGMIWEDVCSAAAAPGCIHNTKSLI